MAQLRQDYDKFQEREAEILVVGPENQHQFQNYWQGNNLPYIGLPDPENRVADLYGQQVKILRMGRLPALVVIDKKGRIRFRNIGDQMYDIPSNKHILSILDRINAEQLVDGDKILSQT